MMNYIWAGLMLVSILCALITGRMDQVSSSILTGAGAGVELSISLLGGMCLWGGIMKIAEEGGVTRLIAKALSPVLSFLFPGIQKGGEAAGAISMNFSANLLGMGNAATPLGIRAIQALKKEGGVVDAADNRMIMFVVINTASIQLIPATIAMLRAQAGCVTPLDILPATWISSIAALTVGIAVAKILERRKGHG